MKKRLLENIRLKINHHHQVVLTLYRHLSQSSIAPSRSSRLHPVSTQSWCKSLLVSQHWCVHEKESIRECCLWVRPYLISSAPHVLFILPGCFVRWEVSSHTTAYSFIYIHTEYVFQMSPQEHETCFLQLPYIDFLYHNW